MFGHIYYMTSYTRYAYTYIHNLITTDLNFHNFDFRSTLQLVSCLPVSALLSEPHLRAPLVSQRRGNGGASAARGALFVGSERGAAAFIGGQQAASRWPAIRRAGRPSPR